MQGQQANQTIWEHQFERTMQAGLWLSFTGTLAIIAGGVTIGLGRDYKDNKTIIAGGITLASGVAMLVLACVLKRRVMKLLDQDQNQIK